jgi:hypothetical protein
LPLYRVVPEFVHIFRGGSRISSKDTIEFRIIERQISMDKPNGKSFASLVYDKLRKYKLPDLMDLMENPIEKHKWKRFYLCFFFLLPCCFLALFSRLGASFQKVDVASLGISKLTLFVFLSMD